MDNLQTVKSFLAAQGHMVIATCDANQKPEAALMGFALAEDLSLVFGTSNLSRKYQNILKNNSVAIVFGDEEKITVQYEGITTQLSGEELNQYKQIYFAKNSFAKQYKTNPDQVYFKVHPKWLRYTDYNKSPHEIFEINF